MHCLWCLGTVGQDSSEGISSSYSYNLVHWENIQVFFRSRIYSGKEYYGGGIFQDTCLNCGQIRSLILAFIAMSVFTVFINVLEWEYHFQSGLSIFCQIGTFNLLNVPDEKPMLLERSCFEHWYLSWNVKVSH